MQIYEERVEGRVIVGIILVDLLSRGKTDAKDDAGIGLAFLLVLHNRDDQAEFPSSHRPSQSVFGISLASLLSLSATSFDKKTTHGSV